MILLLTTFTITVVASVIILNKYIDFASTIITNKTKSSEEKVEKVIYFGESSKYSKSHQKDLVIDIPFTEVKIVKNDRTDHNYNKYNIMLPRTKD